MSCHVFSLSPFSFPSSDLSFFSLCFVFPLFSCLLCLLPLLFPGLIISFIFFFLSCPFTCLCFVVSLILPFSHVSPLFLPFAFLLFSLIFFLFPWMTSIFLFYYPVWSPLSLLSSLPVCPSVLSPVLSVSPVPCLSLFPFLFLFRIFYLICLFFSLLFPFTFFLFHCLSFPFSPPFSFFASFSFCPVSPLFPYDLLLNQTSILI